MQGQAHQNKLLLFQVGPVKCSLFSNDILTIIPPPRQETAGHNGRLPGMFRHNNRIVRVVDMRSKFGLSPSSPERGRLILAEIPKGLVGFWVDQIINVIDQSDGRWDKLPATLPHDVFTRTFVLDEELILHTECPRMEAMRPSAALTQHIESLQKQERDRHARPVTPPSQTPSPEPATPPKPSTQTPPPTRQIASDLKAPADGIRREEAPRPQAASSAARPTPGATARPQASEAKSATITDGNRPKPSTGERPLGVPTSGASKPKPRTPVQERKSPAAPSPRTTVPKLTAPRPETPPATPRSMSPPPERPSFQVPSPPPRPTPAAQVHEAMDSTEPPSDEGNGMMWLFLFLFLLLLGGGVALMYINGLFDTGSESTTAPLAQQAPMTEPSAPAKTVEPVPAASPESESPGPVATAPAETTPAPQAAASTDTTPTTETSTAASGQGENNTPYRADIKKDDQGITITLNGPKSSESEDSLLQEPDQAPASDSGTATHGSSEADKTAPGTTPPAPSEADQATQTPAPQTQAAIPEPKASQPTPPKVAKPKRHKKSQPHMVTHVVVKGDTLWAIAKRYVKDPYRYPELARLSGIKNPDLIYPGDIVRIIEK